MDSGPMSSASIPTRPPCSSRLNHQNAKADLVKVEEYLRIGRSACRHNPSWRGATGRFWSGATAAEQFQSEPERINGSGASVSIPRLGLELPMLGSIAGFSILSEVSTGTRNCQRCGAGLLTGLGLPLYTPRTSLYETESL